MKREVYRYVIDDSISMDEVEATLLLAILAVECLFGESRIRMEAAYSIAKDKHTCVIDATRIIKANALAPTAHFSRPYLTTKYPVSMMITAIQAALV